MLQRFVLWRTLPDFVLIGRTSNVPKTILKATKPVRRENRAAAPSLSYENWLIAILKDRSEAAAYLEAAIEVE